MTATNPLPAVREQIWRRLELRHQDMISLCQRLVRTPSVNGEHPEEAIAAEIASALRAVGVTPEMPTFADGRPCVVASVGQGEYGMLFVGHMDTVAVGDETNWTFDPFGAEIAGSRLYGRGACDNKAGIAIAVQVLGVLRELEDQIDGRVILACVPDEETGATGRLGITPLLENGYLDADAAIYTYPNLDHLSIGHRGLMRVRVEARGEATHTGGDAWESGEQGVNAVTGMAELLLGLEVWQPAFEPHPAFADRRPMVTPGTLISGGHSESMVPDTCDALVDLRLLPGQESHSIMDDMRDIAAEIIAQRPGLSFELTLLIDLPAVAIARDLPIVQSLAHWTEELTGERPVIAGAGPANEGYLLIQAGIPTICGFGPPGGNAHAADEYVEVDGLLKAGKIYAAGTLDVFAQTR